MSFDYTMSADGSQAIAESRRVEASLATIEGRASTIRTKLTQSFRDASGAISGTAASVARTQLALDKMASVGGAFAGLTREMKSEADVLDRLRGPILRHAEDVDRIGRMWKRGILSVTEYNAEMRRLASAKPPAVGAAEKGGGGGIGSMMGRAIGGAMTAGAVLALGKELLELGDSYTKLQNRMKTLGSSEAEVQANMDKTYAVAQRSRMEWNAVGESYARIARATAAMGLSQDRALAVTETLSKAMKLGGGSAEESASAMLQLTQALGSGRLAGEEFNAIAEASPMLLDLIARQMHVNRGQLKALASEGKITTEVMVAAFESAAPEIDRAFGKTAPTLAEGWQSFKNEIMKTVGEMKIAEKVGPILSEAFHLIGGAVKGVLEMLGPMLSLLSELVQFAAPIINFFLDAAKAVKEFAGQIRDFLLPSLDGMIEKMGLATKERADAAIADQNLRVATAQMTIGLYDQAKAFVELTSRVGDFLSKINLAPNAMDKFSDSIDYLFVKPMEVEKYWGGDLTPAKKHAGSSKMKSLKDLGIGEGHTTSVSGGASIVTGLNLEDAMEYGGMGKRGDQASSGLSFEQQLDDVMEKLPKLRDEFDKIYKVNQNWRRETELINKTVNEKLVAGLRGGVMDGFNEIKAEILDVSSLVKTSLVNAFHGLEDAITKAATTGKFEFSEMARSILADLTRIAVRALLVKAITTFGGSGAATSLGFVGAAGGGHDDGGTFRVGGTGGPDSQSVMMRLTPGETVAITPRGESPAGGGRVSIHNHYDRRGLLEEIDSPDGTRAVHNVFRRNRGAFRSS